MEEKLSGESEVIYVSGVCGWMRVENLKEDVKLCLCENERERCMR